VVVVVVVDVGAGVNVTGLCVGSNDASAFRKEKIWFVMIEFRKISEKILSISPPNMLSDDKEVIIFNCTS